MPEGSACVRVYSMHSSCSNPASPSPSDCPPAPAQISTTRYNVIASVTNGGRLGAHMQNHAGTLPSDGGPAAHLEGVFEGGLCWLPDIGQYWRWLHGIIGLRDNPFAAIERHRRQPRMIGPLPG